MDHTISHTLFKIITTTFSMIVRIHNEYVLEDSTWSFSFISMFKSQPKFFGVTSRGTKLGFLRHHLTDSPAQEAPQIKNKTVGSLVILL